ncbi:metal ABC transporter solute-binding protein, Zn/Mn family [Streptomyces syringium]|uniref:Zinc/manganese transport system substrate-binding protein n=1 Tax=Streptomyces syringium TaxID=76729 RepID=A0ABS4YDG7_9ACTN|nr:zinc ABC transporter substrate-binding protein [Streptomyces syringium]MBP2406841.1 zinc/manganese transport system substrate-binding protein [Streptomyces syringium]
MKASSARGPALLVATCTALALGCESGSSGAGSSATGRPGAVPVVASTNVYGDIVRQIGGDRVEVSSIIGDPSQDPHSYEAGTQNQLALSRARVVVENGGGYDDFVGRMLRGTKNSSAQVVNAVRVSGKTPAAGQELNEHLWYDVPAMGKVADRIADALAKAAPGDASAFRRNAEEFRGKLTALQAEEARIKADHGGAAVAVTEPLPLYLTEASGLRNMTPADFSEAVEEGTEVSPGSLRETLDLLTGKRVKALVYNEQTTGPQTEKVKRAAEDHGIPVVPVTETLPAGKDYVGWMTANVHALRRALGT